MLKLATSIAQPIALMLIAQMVQLVVELHAQLEENTSARVLSQLLIVPHVTSSKNLRWDGEF